MAGESFDTVWRVASTTARLVRPGEDDRVEAAREAAEERRRRREASRHRSAPPSPAPIDTPSTSPAEHEPDVPAIGSRLDVRA